MITVLIVNPISSAEYLAAALKKAAIYSIALYFKNPFLKSELKKNLFDHELCFEHFDLSLIIQKLSLYPINFVINGNEFYTHYTDLIAEKITPSYYNSPQCSHHRSNKFWMQECLKQHNLPHIKQIKVSRDEVKLDALCEFNFPVFIKPVNGAASVGGVKANRIEECIPLLKRQPEYFDGGRLDEFVIQEYIQGEEFVIDSFSINNEHYITGVYRYQKEIIGNTPAYRYCEVVHDQSLIGRVCLFAKSVLSACGLHYGFAHTELFLTPNSPYLIEINPRINGAQGATNKIGKLAGFIPQDELLINWLLQKKLSIYRPKPQRHARWVALYKTPHIPSILNCYQEMISIHQESVAHLKGDISFLSVKNLVLLAADNPQEIEVATNYLLEQDIAL